MRKDGPAAGAGGLVDVEEEVGYTRVVGVARLARVSHARRPHAPAVEVLPEAETSSTLISLTYIAFHAPRVDRST